MRPGGELALAVVASAPAAELDEELAQRDAERAVAALEAVARSAPDVAAITAGKKFRVSLLSEYGAKGFEICQVVEGQIDWKVRRQGSGYLA